MSHSYNTIFKPNSVITPITAKTGTTGKHIALIAVGMSAERDVSLMSAKRVIDALIQLQHQVTLIDMGADIANVLMDLKPDIVFNSLHGTYGEDGCLPGLLNIMRIPYTHSGVLASSIGFNKLVLKNFCKSSGINVIKHQLVRQDDNITQDPIKRPYVIKPLNQGSSIGVEIVFDGEDFNFANYNFPYGKTIMVEEYIKGPELQVAVLNGKALGVLEIDILGRRFLDYDGKYVAGATLHIVPARIPTIEYDELMTIAQNIYQILDCNGLVRIDFMQDLSKNKYYLLEVNTHPGMTPTSAAPEIAEYSGLDFTTLISEILKTASFES